MKKQLFISIVAILIIVALMAGCTPEKIKRTQEEPPTEPADNGATDCQAAPDIQGKILEVDEEGGLRILVNADGTLEHSVKGEIWVSITEDTVFAKDVKQDFAVDNTVAIVSDGQIMESYPMQTSARQIQQNYGPDEEPVAPSMEQAEGLPED